MAGKGKTEDKEPDEKQDEKQSTALVPVVGNYAIIKASMDELAEAVRENLGGQQIDIFKLDRVRVPSAGGTTWEIPDMFEESGTTPSKVLEGIIIFKNNANAWWEAPFEETGGGTPPDCASDDGLVGIGKPGGDCSICPLNQWNTAPKRNGTKGKGKACKNLIRLFILRPGSFLPMLVLVPPTSIGNVQQYMLRLTGTGTPYYGVTTKMVLKKAKSEDGIDYAEIEASFGSKLNADEFAKVKAFKEQIEPTLRRVSIVDITQDQV